LPLACREKVIALFAALAARNDSQYQILNDSVMQWYDNLSTTDKTLLYAAATQVSQSQFH